MLDSQSQVNFFTPTTLQEKNFKSRKSSLKEIDEIKLPMINIRRTADFPMNPLNFLSIGISLFMFSCSMMEWCKFSSPIFAVAETFGGSYLLILGIYDWYQGKSFLFFIDYLFGLTHLSIFYSVDLSKYEIKALFIDGKFITTSLLGTFFVVFLITVLICIFTIIRKGIIYIINLGLVALSCVFMIVWQFNQKEERKNRWKETTAGYILFITSISFWFTGLSKIINDTFHLKIIPFLEPTL